MLTLLATGSVYKFDLQSWQAILNAIPSELTCLNSPHRLVQKFLKLKGHCHGGSEYQIKVSPPL